MEEVWNDIQDYKGYYQVSNFGRVRSLERMVTFIQNNKPRTKVIKSRILKSDKKINNMGYRSVILWRNGVGETFFVHKLVAEAFLGFNNGKVVNHKDTNKQNNQLDNLEYITQKENVRHAINAGLWGNRSKLYKEAA